MLQHMPISQIACAAAAGANLPPTVTNHVAPLKLAFHGADTDTDTGILADLSADLSDTPDFPREDPRQDVR